MDEILLEGKRACGVRLADGRVFRAPFVINNGDARRAYTRMLPASAVPERFRRRLEKAGLAESAFTVFLGVNIPPQGASHRGQPPPPSLP